MTPTSALALGMLPAMTTTTTTTTDPAAVAGAAIGGILSLVIALLITGFALRGMFKKAGEPGWAAFVPLYNIIVLLRISGLSPWLVLLAFIPVLQIVLAVLLAINVAKVFGKGAGTAVLIFFFAVIMYFVLSYGSARYLGREAARYPLGQAPQQGPGAAGSYKADQYQS
ncbi:DUF5684 domain-containing protein [Arthrobacter pityocampae]|uniref:DUF5684 domain-containing protein n=1 Tax=Arthrobacter pityocampae TaxID=547334 RepID=UPI00157F97C2|nr:DUF5684 domain-containing protein [Arthrobacter pityocampae]